MQKFNLENLKRKLQNSIQYFRVSRFEFRYVVILLFIGFILSYISPIYNLFILTTNNVFNFHLWRVLTCNFLEPNPILFLWSIFAVDLFLKFIESSWGLLEIVKFIAIVQIGNTLLISILALCLFAFFQTLDLFFYSPICGFTGASIAALIALKQFLPDTVVFATPYGRLKNGHLPLTACFAAFILWLIGLLRSTAVLQVAFGLQISWTYLRFFKVSTAFPSTTAKSSEEIAVVEIRGDNSEHFTWASLFPRRTQPLATIIGTATFRALRALRICRRPIKKEQLNLGGDFNIVEEDETTDTNNLIPESRDAERKRQKALRVLNERLNAVLISTKPSNSNADGGPPPPTAPKQGEEDELIDLVVVKMAEQENNQIN